MPTMMKWWMRAVEATTRALGTLVLAATILGWSGAAAGGTHYYVRQTVGDDSNDGTSPQTAWQHIARLSSAMHAGDTAYIGPGLYRDEIRVQYDGTQTDRIIFIADTTGQYTGDPPGIVMITGAEPVDESVFVPDSAPGVYKASFPRVLAVVEMDGDQYRYKHSEDTPEHKLEKLSLMDVVVKVPSSEYFDEAAHMLYIHTSDGKHPREHEIEIMKRGQAIDIQGKDNVTVAGFTFRHMYDAPIHIHDGSDNVIAVNNTSWGGRQGIRVYNATNALIYGNTLFRNDNSGVYFAAKSTGGRVIRNVSYENIKGVRWSSDSRNALVLDNVLFDNHDAGIAVENAPHAIIRGNQLVSNRKYQLFVINSELHSEENCFKSGSPEQLIANIDFESTETGHRPAQPFYQGQYKTLAEYQRGRHLDMHSREGDCGPLPQKVDVHKLHAESMAYTEKARAILKASQDKEGPEPKKTETK